jgi:hypothetical protein
MRMDTPNDPLPETKLVMDILAKPSAPADVQSRWMAARVLVLDDLRRNAGRASGNSAAAWLFAAVSLGALLLTFLFPSLRGTSGCFAAAWLVSVGLALYCRREAKRRELQLQSYITGVSPSTSG